MQKLDIQTTDEIPSAQEGKAYEITGADEFSSQVRENVQGGIGFGSDQSETHSFGLGPSGQPVELSVETVYGKRYVKRNPKRNSSVVLRK